MEMNKIHVKYPKIAQYRNVVADIKHKVKFNGIDETGNVVYLDGIDMPKIKFKGTVKLHGTNAAVCYNNSQGLWVQSRSKIISVGNDNYGFAMFVEQHRSDFIKLFFDLKDTKKIDLHNTVVIFGEWAGEGIQNGVGISEFEKSFYIFGAKEMIDEEGIWRDHTDLRSDNRLIHNIEEFPTYSIDIDFNNPELVQSKLSDITDKVEQECPVSKQLGKPNQLGEGIVWTGEYDGELYRFKVKGQKHSSTNVKKLAKVDVEKLNSMIEFADYAVTLNRVEQGVQVVKEEMISESLSNVNKNFNLDKLSPKMIGRVIGWVVKDVLEEEVDTIVANNIDAKLVKRFLSDKARKYIFQLMEHGTKDTRSK